MRLRTKSEANGRTILPSLGSSGGKYIYMENAARACQKQLNHGKISPHLRPLLMEKNGGMRKNIKDIMHSTITPNTNPLIPNPVRSP